MFHPVYPIHRRPLVVRTGVDYRFTALVVDQVDAVDGRYEVLFLGTGETGAGVIGCVRLMDCFGINVNIISLTSRSRYCTKSYSFAKGPNEHGGTDTRGSGGFPGMSKYVLPKTNIL